MIRGAGAFRAEQGEHGARQFGFVFRGSHDGVGAMHSQTGRSNFLRRFVSRTSTIRISRKSS